MKSVNANKINRKSGEAEGSAVSLSGTAKAPWANRLRLPFHHQRKLQIPRLRFGMTKGRVVAHLGSGGGGWTEPVQQQQTLFSLPALFNAFSKLRRLEGRSPANLDSSDI
jgi:hypothetical protein